MRRAFFAALLMTAATAAVLPAQAAPDVALALDEVHTLAFPASVATVYVGNPTIADITMIDSRHAFLQGKSYGRTNIVALDRDGTQVFSAHVSVTGSQGGNTVILNRGAQRITLNCTGGRCEPTPMPGDGKDSYDPGNGVTAAHQNAARTAASADAGATVTEK